MCYITQSALVQAMGCSMTTTSQYLNQSSFDIDKMATHIERRKGISLKCICKNGRLMYSLAKWMKSINTASVICHVVDILRRGISSNLSCSTSSHGNMKIGSVLVVKVGEWHSSFIILHGTNAFYRHTDWHVSFEFHIGYKDRLLWNSGEHVSTGC